MRRLALIIDVRERVYHGSAGGIEIQQFAVFTDYAYTVHLPMWNDNSGSMTRCDRLGNLFRFVQDSRSR